jgi:hypothetical protein
VSGSSVRARLETAAAAVDGDGRVIGVGWATVDLDRAAVELAAALDLEPGDFAEAPESVALGARCRIALDAIDSGQVAVVVLEPATEGRLARRLARHDEGPAVVWLSGGGKAGGGETPGPFGPEALQAADPDRPDLLRSIVAQPPGTIRS